MTLRKRIGGAAVQAARRIPSDISIRFGETFRLGSLMLLVATLMRGLESAAKASEPDKGSLPIQSPIRRLKEIPIAQ